MTSALSPGDGVPTVFVAVAGRSNGLGPVMSGNTAYPVINCPPLTPDWGAQDVWSSLRMPSGNQSPSFITCCSTERVCVCVHALTAPPPLWSRSGLLHRPLPRCRCPVRGSDLRAHRPPGVVQAEGLHAQHLGGPEAGRPEAAGLQPLRRPSLGAPPPFCLAFLPQKSFH